MASYFELYQDFVQKKKVDRNAAPVPEEEDENVEQSVEKPASTEPKKMEHSYSHDTVRPSSEQTTGLAPARTILVRRPPQCPSCHTHPLEEHDLEDGNQVPVPAYNEIAAKEAMYECARIAKYVKNSNPDDEDWELRLNKMNWSNLQRHLFEDVVRILDSDQLGRLANVGRQHEAMQRRVTVDKSAARTRKVLASIAWDTRLTQWLHGLLMDSLPAAYMASYLDILQTLKTKLPSQIDKMLFGRPLNISQELLAPVLRKKWEPQITAKTRKLPQNVVIVAMPSIITTGPLPNRILKWYQYLGTIAPVVQVTVPVTSNHMLSEPLDQVAEQIVSLTRVKIQELRTECSTRSIVLVGFNAGSALALQVAISECIACVICMGFAYHTYNGPRGSPDDRLLDIKAPIQFVIGQNSARSSPEEIESLREKMQSESTLVVVGCADDALRVPKSRRRIENVTQDMVDTMVTDEVYEFIKKILANPPGPRIPTSIGGNMYAKQNKVLVADTGPVKGLVPARKRKHEGGEQVGRPRTRVLPNNTMALSPSRSGGHVVTSTPLILKSSQQQQQKQLSPNSITSEDLNLALQSILTDDSNDRTLNDSGTDPAKLVTNYEIVARSKSTPIKTAMLNPPQKQSSFGNASAPGVGTKIKMIQSNQFVQIKPPLQSQSKIYTIKPAVAPPQQGVAGGGGVSIGSIVTTKSNAIVSGQQQIFTLKSPNGQTTQFVTAASPAAQQKYTVIKNAAGGTTLHLTSPAGGAKNLDLSNINDIPIVFADNEGNLTDTMAAKESTKAIPESHSLKSNTSSGVGQLIISQKIIKEAPGNSPTKNSAYIVNKSTPNSALIPTVTEPTTGKSNKVIFISRGTMKPVTNVLGRSQFTQPLQNYAKLVISNSAKSSSPNLVAARAGAQMSSGTTNTVKPLNLQPLKSPPVSTTTTTMGTVNVGTRCFQILNNSANVASTSATSSSSATTSTGDKLQIRNIMLKPGGLKQIPTHLKSQLLNRNLTVRKLVNILPPGTTKSATTSQTLSGVTITVAPPHATIATVAATEVARQTDCASTTVSASPASSVGGSSMQSSPKIITLNPINPGKSD